MPAPFADLPQKAIEEWNKVFENTLGISNYITAETSDGSQNHGATWFNMIQLGERPSPERPGCHGGPDRRPADRRDHQCRMSQSMALIWPKDLWYFDLT